MNPYVLTDTWNIIVSIRTHSPSRLLDLFVYFSFHFFKGKTTKVPTNHPAHADDRKKAKYLIMHKKPIFEPLNHDIKKNIFF